MEHWKVTLLAAVAVGVLAGVSKFLFFRDVGTSMEQQQKLREAMQNRPKKNAAGR